MAHCHLLLFLVELSLLDSLESRALTTDVAVTQGIEQTQLSEYIHEV